jgi:hypothetical protein
MDAARRLWLLSTIYRIEKLDTADVELIRLELSTVGIPEDLVEKFLGNATEAVGTLSLHVHPSEIVMHAPNAGAGGLSRLFEDVDLPNFNEVLEDGANHAMQNKFLDELSPIGPVHEAGSPEDLAMWEKAWQGQISFVESLDAGLEEHYAEKGKRNILGIPSHEIKDQMTARIAELQWIDAPMWAAKTIDTLPDWGWLEERVNTLVESEKISATLAYVLWRLSGGSFEQD